MIRLGRGGLCCIIGNKGSKSAVAVGTNELQSLYCVEEEASVGGREASAAIAAASSCAT